MAPKVFRRQDEFIERLGAQFLWRAGTLPPMTNNGRNLSEPYVELEALVQYFHISRSAFRKLILAGRIPSIGYPNGKRVFRRFRISEVEQALRQSDAELKAQGR